MVMARNLRTKNSPSQQKRKFPPLFSIDCLTQPTEDSFYRINESLMQDSGVSTFLASVLFKNKDTEKIKKHVKEIGKGFSDEKFKNLLKTQNNLNYRRLADDIKPILDILNIPHEHSQLFLIDIKQSKFDIPKAIEANYLVGIHDSKKNITRILKIYNAKTVELKMLVDLKKDGFTFIE